VTANGRRIGILSLDTSDALLSGREPRRLHRVELELDHSADEELLHALRDALLGVDGIAPDQATKLERALSVAELPAERP
jgi:hypothetical protein